METNNLMGIDVDIEISLHEYGFAYEDKGDEIRIWLGIDCNEVGYDKFDWLDLPKNTDILKEFDWVDINDVLSFTGMSLNDWLELPLWMKFHDLVQYYGYIEFINYSMCPYKFENNQFLTI
jgi:hypothetical protein